jgi:hypothetical protein
MVSVAQDGVCGEIRLSLSEIKEGAQAPIEDEAVEVAA